MEEALLRTGRKNFCLLNEGSAPAIVLGLSNRLEELVDLEVWQKDPIPLIRRFSGGGTVVVDEDTFFATFIFQDKELRQTPEKIHAIMNALYQKIFPSFQLIENDYVFKGRKFGGNAQSITKGRWLHHTSFLFDYNPCRMRYLNLPKNRPNYRQERNHEAFLCTLKEHFPSLEALKNAFLSALQKQFHCSFPPLLEVERALKEPHRQATSFLTP